MKHWLLSFTALAVLACTPAAQEETPSGSGGTTSGGTGGSKASGGTTPSGNGGTTPSGSGGTTPSGSGGSGTGGVAAAGGSSGSGGAGGGSPATDAATMEGGGTPPSGTPGSALHDQVFKVACANPDTAGGGCSIGKAGYGADNGRSFSKVFEFGGDPTKTYKLTFKLCAVFEYHKYNMCAAGSPNDTEICVDGTLDTTASHPTYPTLAMKVSEPMKTYLLNKRGRNDTLFKYDYMATVDVKGGAKITIESDGGNNTGIYTAKMIMAQCPAVPGIANQPYGGQFAHFQVVSATAQ